MRCPSGEFAAAVRFVVSVTRTPNSTPNSASTTSTSLLCYLLTELTYLTD